MIEQQSDQESAQRKLDELIAGLGDWRGERLYEVRKLIHDAGDQRDDQIAST